MRGLLAIGLLLLPQIMVAQRDEADDASILYIRAVYDSMNTYANQLVNTELEDGSVVSTLRGNVRRIVRRGSKGIRTFYYYSAHGMPIFVFQVSESNEERYYFSPQLGGTNDRYGMIRWLVGQEHHSPEEEAFQRKEGEVLAAAFNLIHRAKGEIEFTPEVYNAIVSRLERADNKFSARQLIVVDTINHLEPEPAPDPSNGEPDLGCVNRTVRFTGAALQKTLRTIHTEGCDPGCMAYVTNVLITDYDDEGTKLRETAVTDAALLIDPDGKGVINTAFPVSVRTYFDAGRPVYQITKTYHQGYEVSQQLIMLKD